MKEPARFAESVFERIAGYLPAELHKSYYTYLAHVRTLSPDDHLVVMLEGMAILALITRQMPEAISNEREKFIAELGVLFHKHNAAMTNGTADLRALLSAHQKLLEQNIGAWQSREQQTVQALDRTAKRFEENADKSSARISAAVANIESVTSEHRSAAQAARNWVTSISWTQFILPCIGSAALGALAVAAIVYFRVR